MDQSSTPGEHIFADHQTQLALDLALEEELRDSVVGSSGSQFAHSKRMGKGKKPAPKAKPEAKAKPAPKAKPGAKAKPEPQPKAGAAAARPRAKADRSQPELREIWQSQRRQATSTSASAPCGPSASASAASSSPPIRSPAKKKARRARYLFKSSGVWKFKEELNDLEVSGLQVHLTSFVWGAFRLWVARHDQLLTPTAWKHAPEKRNSDSVLPF